MTAGCIQSLYSEKSKRFMWQSLPVQQQKPLLFSQLPCVAADVGLEGNLHANCLFLRLPSDIDEP